MDDDDEPDIATVNVRQLMGLLRALRQQHDRQRHTPPQTSTRGSQVSDAGGADATAAAHEESEAVIYRLSQLITHLYTHTHTYSHFAQLPRTPFASKYAYLIFIFSSFYVFV